MVGNDVMHMFKEALVRKGVDVRPVALVNDTVGTLMAKAYSNPSCRIGVILGTGTNGAYVERASSIPKWPGSRDGFMVINMEWGGFGSGEMGRSLLPVGFFRVAFWGRAVSEQVLPHRSRASTLSLMLKPGTPHANATRR